MTAWRSEAIISDVIGCGPEVQIGSGGDGWMLSRWRQFVGSYALPPLPEPLFVVHIAGKPGLRTWMRDGWSETASMPGDVTILPAHQPTRFLVDGELDAMTFSVSPDRLQDTAVKARFEAMRFAFADPLGAVLAQRILGELYAPHSPARDAYIQTLTDALHLHVLQAPAFSERLDVGESGPERLQDILRDITDRPGEDHSLTRLATRAGVTPSHLCRLFRKATGLSPHAYVLKARIDRAKSLLAASNLSLTHIAHSLRFNDQSHFTRTFSRETGCTPGEFRRRRGDQALSAPFRLSV